MNLSSSLHVKIDPRGAESGAKRVNSSLDSIKRRANSSASSMNALRSAILYLGGGIIIASLTRLDDAWVGMVNKMKLVSSDLSLVSKNMESLQDIAYRTGATLDSTSTIYARLALASKDTGFRTAQLMRVVETLNKQVLIGGNRAEEAHNGLIQFAQGIASGKLQGDELRSVMENLLGVQVGLIRGFKLLREAGEIDFTVTKSNIRDLASQGILTSGLLIKSLLKVSSETDELFTRFEFTFIHVLNRLTNKIVETIGSSDTIQVFFTGAKDAINGFTNSIDTIVEILDDVKKAFLVTASAVTVFFTVIAVHRLFLFVTTTKILIAQLIALQVSLGASSIAMAAFTAATKWAAVGLSFLGKVIKAHPILFLIGVVSSLTLVFRGLRDETSNQVEVSDNYSQKLKDLNSQLKILEFQGDASKEAIQELNKAISEHRISEAERLSQRATSNLREAQGALRKAENDLVRILKNSESTFSRNLKDASTSIFGGLGLGLDNLAVESDASKVKKLIELVVIYGRNVVTFGDQSKQIDKILGDLVVNDKKDKALSSFEKRLAKINREIGLLDLSKLDQAVTKDLDKFKGKFREGDISEKQIGIAEDRITHLHYLRKAKSITEEFKDTQDRLNERVTLYNLLRDKGVLTEGAYQAAVKATREEELEYYNELAAKREESATDWVTGYQIAMRKLSEETKNYSQLAQTTIQNFSEGFADAFVRMAETGKLSFKDLARSIISDLIRVHAKAVALNLLQGFFSGPPAAAHSTDSSVIGNHFGISQGGEQSALLAAQGFENGGNVRSNIPIIVGERGPEIFTPNRTGKIIPNHNINQGTQQKQIPTINLTVHIDASGSEAVDERIAASGENTFRRVMNEVLDQAQGGGPLSQAVGVR